jgi:hypothetical protein
MKNRWTCEQRKGLTVRVQNKGELDIEKIHRKNRNTNEQKKIEMWLKKDIWSTKCNKETSRKYNFDPLKKCISKAQNNRRTN